MCQYKVDERGALPCNSVCRLRDRIGKVAHRSPLNRHPTQAKTSPTTQRVVKLLAQQPAPRLMAAAKRFRDRLQRRLRPIPLGGGANQRRPALSRLHCALWLPCGHGQENEPKLLFSQIQQLFFAGFIAGLTF